MDNTDLLDDFSSFWEDFFNSRRWKYAKLARELSVNPDVVSKWVRGKNAIRPENISKLLENQTVNLQPDEAAWLMRLYLLHAGFSQKSLPYITSALAGGNVCQGDDLDRRTILAFSPLSSENTSFHSKILQIFTERATQLTFRVISQSVPTEGKLDLHEYYPDLDKICGVVAISCHVEESNWLEECRDTNVPIVLVHDSIEEYKLKNRGKVSIIWEKLNGLEDLVKHLIQDHHCKNIRIVAANPTGRYHRTRKIKKIKDVAHGYEVDIDIPRHVLPVKEYTYKEGFFLAQSKIMPNIRDVDAVICFYDEVALAIWNVAKDNRQNLVVTGYDDIDPAEHLGITSIRQKRAERATLALLEILRARDSALKDYPHTHWIETELKPRASCGCP